jgi:nucleoside 2-deoxyribosyltransferase
MRDYEIYLCGGMTKFKDNFEKGNKWRVYLKAYLEDSVTNYNVYVTNPNDYYSFAENAYKYDTESEVMRFDLYKLRKSNLVIVNFNDAYSLGSMAEIAIAYDRGIPIIGLNEDGQTLHPWHIEMVEKIFTDIDELLLYVKRFYLT